MITDECCNKWCIYYEADRCTLAGITLNVFGMCEICVMLDPDEGLAAPLRRKVASQLDWQDDAMEKQTENDRLLL